METNEQKPDETKEEVVKEEVQAEGEVKEGEEAEVKDTRPEINYVKELERKNAEINRLRQQQERMEKQAPNRRDPNDISTWNDNELRVLSKSVDPNLANFRDQAEEILMDRRIKRVRDSERAQEKQLHAELELRSTYPQAFDPASEFAARLENVMYDLDLHKSPAGRLAAAKIVAAEMTGSKSKASSVSRKSEDSRIRDVKSQMVDGDRFKSAEVNTPKKTKDLENKIRSEGTTQAEGLGEALRARGISRENFFKH